MSAHRARAFAWAALGSAGLVGCLLRPSPAHNGGTDAGHGSGHPDGSVPGPDAIIPGDAISGSGSGGPGCPSMVTIDSFEENMQCGDGTTSGNGSAFASAGVLPMLAYDPADGPKCTWGGILVGNGFYVELYGPPAKLEATVSLASGGQTATIQAMPDAVGSGVDLSFTAPSSTQTVKPVGLTPPVYVGFLVTGSTVSLVYDSGPITSVSPSMGTAKFTSSVIKADLQLGTISTEENVTFTTFDCVQGPTSTRQD